MNLKRVLAGAALVALAPAGFAAMVTFDPVAFPGDYIVFGQAPNLTRGTGLRTVDLAPGSYSIDIGGVGACSRKQFVVNADGTVSNHPTADASGSLEFIGSTVRFRNAPLAVDPGAFPGRVQVQLSILAGLQGNFFQAGARTYTAVPDTIYRVRTDGSASFTHVLLDRDGTVRHPVVHPSCAPPGHVAPAEAFDGIGATMRLRTATIRIDPRAYPGRYYVMPFNGVSTALGLVSGVRDVNLVSGFETQLKTSSLAVLGYLSFRVRPDGTLEHYAQAIGDSSARVDLDNTTSPAAVRFRTATVHFDPDRYEGAFRFDVTTPAAMGGTPFFGPTSLVVVPDMNYDLRIGSTQQLNRVAFRVDAAGQVSGIPVQSMVDGSTVLETSGSSARMLNSRIAVKPGDGSRWRITDVTPSQPTGITGLLRFYLVPGMTWQLADLDPTVTTTTFLMGEPCLVEPPGPFALGGTTYEIDCVPQADAGTDQTVNEGSQVTLDGAGGGTASAEVAFHWTQVGGPAVSLVDANTATPRFTAPAVSPAVGSQVLTFELVVSDGVASSDPDTVDVTVLHVNHAPVADAGDDVQVREGATVQLKGTASFDPDGTALTYSWTQTGGPSVALQPNAFVASPSFQAPLGAAMLTFQLIVSDGALASGPDSVNVTTGPNNPPVADAGADQSVDENATVRLNGGASRDPDNDTITFSWSQVAGPAVVLDDPTAASPAFPAPAVGGGGAELAFRLVVTDDYTFNPQASAPDLVTVLVRNVGEPPRCDAAQASPASLWPPNHKMHEVSIAGLAADAAVTINAVTQDEPTSGQGDGDTAPDAVLQGSRVLIRAERSGSGNGRVYAIRFTATQSGLSCGGTVKVTVPQSRNAAAIDDGQSHVSTQP